MRSIPFILCALLVLAVVPVDVGAQNSRTVTLTFQNAAETNEAGDAVYHWQDTPILLVEVTDANGDPVDVRVEVYTSADEWNGARIRTAQSVQTGADGLALIPLDEDILSVGWLPGDHTAVTFAHFGEGDFESAQAGFTTQFP